MQIFTELDEFNEFNNTFQKGKPRMNELQLISGSLDFSYYCILLSRQWALTWFYIVIIVVVMVLISVVTVIVSMVMMMMVVSVMIF